MSDEAAFLNALKANPADNVTRLVYADWLDEHDQLQKAEYLRLIVGAVPMLAAGDLDPTLLESVGRLAGGFPADWRLAAGCRFGVRFDGFDPGYKVEAIKFIREITGLGLGGSKQLVESAPQTLPVAATLEGATGMKAVQFGWRLTILPEIPSREVPRTVGAFSVLASIGYDGHAPIEEAELAFRNFLTAALGIPAERADDLMQAPRDVELCSGLEYPEVEKRLRNWRSLLPPEDPGRYWGIYLQTLCAMAPALSQT